MIKDTTMNFMLSINAPYAEKVNGILHSGILGTVRNAMLGERTSVVKKVMIVILSVG